jgi:hypothetical protein
MFFRRAAAEAISRDGRNHTPWLSAVYSCLSAIGRDSPESFTCSRDEFRAMVQRDAGGPDSDPDLLLVDAERSNFLAYDDQLVWPKIRLLGRIAAVSHRGVFV